jgi:hypothetical protein
VASLFINEVGAIASIPYGQVFLGGPMWYANLILSQGLMLKSASQLLQE